MAIPEGTPPRVRWARLRFQIIGALLASPPEPGELGVAIDAIASRTYEHPTTGDPMRFGRSTIERWYYTARNEAVDPLRALERRVHARAGTHGSVGAGLDAALRAQHRAHPRWSFKLHHDNLVAWAKTDTSIGKVPSYTTMRRYMKSQGLLRSKKKLRARATLPDGTPAVFVPREVRSYEATHTSALWHLDFHDGKRRVVTTDGRWVEIALLGVMDDRSRLLCHLQWYLGETAEALVHGLIQAIEKRGLPRSLMTDNGSAMLATETREGLARLGIVHHTTLPYTPEQNAKQESFWGQVEGRLMAMLEGKAELTLELLNRATIAWVEMEYNRGHHSELGTSPLERWLEGPSVGRPSPSSIDLRRAFRRQETRTQRRSDGTLTVEGTRFEIPARYRTIARPTVRYVSWDLSSVDLVDPRSGRWLTTLLPIDKESNADGRRRVVPAVSTEPTEAEPTTGIAPLLEQLMAEYAATGLPPAYVPLPAHEPQEEER